MNGPIDEQLSALADGELRGDELPLLLRRAAGDPELPRRLGRYALIRDALSRNLPPVVDLALADRVERALEDEPVHAMRPVSTRRGSRSWLRPVAGFAVAASVAVMGVALWPTMQQTGDQPATTSVASDEQGGASADLQTVSVSDNVQWDRLDPETRARLNGYAVSHGEEAAGRQVSIIPQHVRITGHSIDRQ